ncbi:hypothetical protein C2845_PM13G04590 [Panicum miliaceum]|uniref:Uncharacterized protein n=1 Tax=Panicum miliaceum TaxID=4540 RepID=A0A3L6RKZ3_PANMI|nr:hypothetical protein C2845_PM13G04590 [Panicum miliaceum]
MATPQPHAVVVPYPGSGNINPALQLAQLLRRHSVFITFVVTEHNLRRAEAAAEVAARGREGFRVETIPDGLVDADRDEQDYDLDLSKATTQRCAAPLRELVARLRGGAPGVPPVTSVLPTSLMSFALEVARELGVPSMVLWGGSAAALMGHTRLRELKERGYLPLKGSKHEILWGWARCGSSTRGYRVTGAAPEIKGYGMGRFSQGHCD